MSDLLSVAEALGLVLSHAATLPARRLPLADCLGLVLAEDAASDVDSPPHDKSMVDGYALRAADVMRDGVTLAVIEEITAGQVPQRALEPGTCARIMTGAPIPVGCDAVLMHERTELAESQKSEVRSQNEEKERGTRDDGRGEMRSAECGVRSEDAKVRSTKYGEQSANSIPPVPPNAQRPIPNPQLILFHELPRPNQNIIRRASSLAAGEVVLTAGTPLTPARIGLLAEVGRADVLAVPRPRVAIVSTGNELVEPHELPGPGAIRNSNGPLLAAAVEQAGGVAVPLGIARDTVEDLRTKIALGLQADVLILSGGVSAGVLDLVPGVLAEFGVRPIFHKIKLKPGKPLFFGIQNSEFRMQNEGEGLGTRDEGRGEMRSAECGVRSEDAEVRSTKYGEQRANSIPPVLQPPASSLQPPSAPPNAQRPTPNPQPLIFGLPGNPVSSAVCFELFVRPALRKLMGHAAADAHRTMPARLATPFAHKGDRPTYFPATLEQRGDERWVRPVRWTGSADLCGYARGEVLIVFRAGERAYAEGDVVEVIEENAECGMRSAE